ncbi:MAG TPA: GDP-mannose 4,6-dehydratase [Longimicrobiales bacterium]
MSFGSDRAVVITGGAGFIGSNLADVLLHAGERVIIYDNLSRPGTEKNLRWLVQRHPKALEVELADIRDAERVGRVVRRAHTVYHLAAQVAVTSSLTDPGHDFTVNAKGTLNVLQAARDAEDPPVVLFTSTNKVYGALAGVPVVLNGTRYLFGDRRVGIAEDQPLDFHSPYGCSKGAADQYVRDYARIYDLPTCVFRMSCIYGPRQFGNEDQGWVAHFVISALSGRPITVYGDGKQVRDILFVDDLVDLMIRSARKARDQPGRIYNVGGGAGNAVSLIELLDLLEAELGRTVERRHAPWRPGDQRIYISDIGKLQRELGWAPRVSKEEGVRRLIAWIQENASVVLPARAARVEQPLSA